MQLPFKFEDVRLISIDGDTIRFVLTNGHVEVKIDSRNPAPRDPLQAPTASRIDPRHIMFDDGIFGL